MPDRSLLQRLLSLEILAPVAIGILFLSGWQFGVQLTHTPSYILPKPTEIVRAAIADRDILFPAALITLKITIVAFLTATISGVLLAMLMAQSKWIEKSLYPYAIILQTIPIAAIAPLIIIWLGDNTFVAIVLCAWIVAFFPIVANTTFGLNSLDPNLQDLFRLYQASRWQTMLYLRLPSALPYFFAGLRISGGLSLIGAVVAEIVAGAGGSNSGLAYQILIASYDLKIPRLFAAVFLISTLGIAIFIILNSLSNFVLGSWHDSSRSLDR